jgi:hypothetical protein
VTNCQHTLSPENKGDTKKSSEGAAAPAAWRACLLAEYRVSERRACATVFLHRSVYRYLDQPRDDRAVRQRMKEIAETRVRYGFNRIHILLRREGWRETVAPALRI